MHMRHTYPYPTKCGGIRCYHLFKTASMQTTKISIDSFQRYWLWKNPKIWLDKRNNWSHAIKCDSFRSCDSLKAMIMQKKLRHQLTLSNHIDNQRILQSHWKRGLNCWFVPIDILQRHWWSKNPVSDQMRGTTGHTQPKVVVSGVTFPCSEKIWKKLRYNLILSRDIVIWLDKRHHLVTPRESWWSQMLFYLNDFLHA